MASSVPHPSACWEAMPDGNTFYRRQEVYTMQWSNTMVQLTDFVIAAARYGGPLALLRDETKVVQYGKHTMGKPQIVVFSSSGGLVCTIPWELGKIIKMGWTFDEQLVVLNEEGVYRLYDLQGEYTQFSLGNEAQEVGLVDARIHESGLVGMLGNLSLLEVKGWEGGKPLTLATSGMSAPPHFWNVIPPDQTISRHVEVLLALDSTILSVDNLESVDQHLSRGPFQLLAVSPNGKSLALFNNAGLLWVVSSDFQRSDAEYDTSTEGQTVPPRQLVWCGNDALVLVWDVLVLVVGPFGNTLRYYYTSPPFAIGEIDGVRVVSSERCDFIQKVPNSALQVFRPGSTSPAALLFDALSHYELKSPKSDENIRSIRPELASAVDICIEAAGQEIEPFWQRRLLNAALFGRAFLDLINPVDFVDMGQTLKVLNAVRFYEIGIPITYVQFTYTTAQHLISRLTARNLHLLALRVSSYLHLKSDVVLRHWACAKIAKSTTAEAGDDEAICALIVKKFEDAASVKGGVDVGHISYAEIAKKAWALGRGRLATMLLDHEPQAADQVPLLLTMKEDRLALTKAVDSGDTDLVYHVLLHVKRRLPLGAFFRLLEDGGPGLAPAVALLQVYAKEQDRELLKDFWFQDDRRVESACASIEEAATMTDYPQRIDSTKAAAKFFSEDKDRVFEARTMDDSVRLLTTQQQLEKEVDGKIKFFGLSVNETIRSLIMNGLNKKAEKVRGDWKVSEKRWWYAKLHALIAIRDFDSLETFAKSKRSPIGYEPFVNYLLGAGYQKQAVPYVARCDAGVRADLYVKCGEWKMAGEFLKEKGEKGKLEDLRKACPNSLIARELDQLLASMK